MEATGKYLKDFGFAFRFIYVLSKMDIIVRVLKIIISLSRKD